MENNADTIKRLIDYIEEHIDEDISLEDLAQEAGYSMYHLHRMFSGLVGFTVHQYIVRRKLTESARKLILSDESVIDISMDAGYESQQAYTLAFKNMYKMSPARFRKIHEFRPIQLKFDISGNLTNLKGDRIMDIRTVDSKELIFAGFKANTGKGFFVIPRLWKKINKIKNRINNRSDENYLVGLNDYTHSNFETSKPAFDCYAAAEITDTEGIDPQLKLDIVRIPACRYVVFTYYGRAQDSVQPVMDYIYKEWFPQSEMQLNEQVKMDFVRYGELVNEKGQNQIEVWIPVL